MLDFLLENSKLAYIDEVKFYLEDEWGIEVSAKTAHRLIQSLQMTKKVVSYSLSIGALLTNILARR